MNNSENAMVVTPSRWVVEFDENNKIVSCELNRQFLKLLGFDSQEEFDQSAYRWSDFVHPDDADTLLKYLAGIQADTSERCDYDIEYSLMTRSGYCRVHESDHCVRRNDGSVSKLYGVLFNIQDINNFETHQKHDSLRKEILDYIVSHDEDPVTIFKTFADRVRSLLGCDQIIYHGLEEIQLMAEAPDLEDSLRTAPECCSDCPYSNPCSTVYADGYIEMFDSQEGWKGIPAHPNCRVKSIISRTVYCNGEVNGYLTVHYIRQYHHFTDLERKTIEDFARNLSLAISRYKYNLYFKNIHQREIEETNKLIESISSNYNIAYVVDLKDDSFVELRMDSDVIGYGIHFDNFTQAKMFFINNAIHMSDKEWMQNELDYETIRQRLTSVKSYKKEYRAIMDGVTVWHEMNISAIGNDKVAICFGMKDTEIIKRHLEEKRYDEFFALFEADLDTGMLKTIKCDYERPVPKIEHSVKYTPFFEEFANSLDDNYRDFFIQIADINLIRQRLADEDKITYSYKSLYLEGDKWIDVIIDVINRHSDGTPAIITIGFSIVDTFASVRQELQKRLTTDMQLIGGLASSYHALYFFNVKENFFTTYSLDRKKYPKAAKMVEKGGNPLNIIHNFGQSNLVHPDDRYLFEELNQTTIMERLSHQKKFRVRFRRKYGEKFLWTEMDVIKNEEEDEPANAISVCFAERDAEIRAEKEHQQLIYDNFATVNALADRYSSVYSVNLETGQFTTYAMDEATREAVSKIMAQNDNYLDTYKLYVEKFVYEPDRAMMLRECTIENIYARLANSDSYTITFRMNMNGVISFCELKYAAARKQDGKVKSLVIGFAHNNDEIMAQYINENLFSEYISAFIVDLDNDIYKIYRAPITTRVMEREDRIWSKALSDFALECNPEYHELITNLSSPDFLKKELAEVDRREYFYRFPSQIKPWRRCVIKVLDRTDGVPSNVLATFIAIDDFQSKIRDQQIQLESQQKQLEKAYENAQVANIAKSEFLFNMSHDIRTPMNAITGFTAMAKKVVNEPEKLSAYLNKIDISSRQLLMLINQVLEMSRIESGKIELDEGPVNIKSQFESLVTVISEQAKDSGLNFKHSIQNATHFNIIADNARMSQIAFNIVGNAIKFTPAGGLIEMTMIEHPCEREGYVRYSLRVRDTGIGMSKEFQKIMFEPFSREKRSTVSKIQGTGLGMSIVKSITDMMEGTLTVESELNKGTTFECTFDFRIDTSAVNAPEKPVINTDSAIFKGRRVLLVEDNELNREIAKFLLIDNGMVVEDAEDGDIAVDIVKRYAEQGDCRHFDLILMDVQMPKMNGYTATKMIREIPSPEGSSIHIPIIAMTANAFEEDRQNALAAGMDDHIAKPIDVKRLWNTLAKYL